MPLIKPFAGLRPVQSYAQQVIAPPYDVLNTQEARLKAHGNEYSFLHISKPEIDLPENTDPYAREVYQTGADNFQRLIKENVLEQDETPCYYFYRLVMGQHEQTGLVAVASVPDYDTNRIRKHEFTRPEKEDDRVNQIDALNAQTGPVFLTYRHSEIVDSISEKVCATEPEYDLKADDGIQHTLWKVDTADDIEVLSKTFDAMECLYIADGHHRSAAASRVAKQRNQDSTTDGLPNYFLSVIFPDNQMKILDYNRVVKDLNGLTDADFLKAIENNFEVTPLDTQSKPGNTGVFSMYLNKKWYQLAIQPSCIPVNDPVASLDVSLLQNNLIEPILGISDPRRDKRIDFVGGIRGLDGLEKRVDSGEMAVAFALYPTTLSQLMSVADANEVMPPKSTWFEPKLADGLVSYMLE